jgi:hypothetical protein
MPPVGFKHTISASAWLQTYALDRAATGIGKLKMNTININRGYWRSRQVSYRRRFERDARVLNTKAKQKKLKTT